ncbi:MAG: DUF4097 family beta strand repeat protein [Thermoanaerobaculia bacterium]|nr:MAG: DUF4097 family beta strand repeat protein [Thermoanaerobaculia bacterium]
MRADPSRCCLLHPGAMQRSSNRRDPAMLRPLATAALLAVFALSVPALAAPEPERLVIPLSDPSRPARIEVGLVMGSIRVVPGKPGEVVLVAAAPDEDARDADARDHRVPGWPREASPEDEERQAARAGMRRLPNDSFGLEAEERDNTVEIGAGSWTRPVDLRIEAPPASSVDASTVNGGELAVSGLAGELVLHNTNGDIRVTDVTGPVNASTVNGDVQVSFGRTMASAAMAFSTLNGDVELTLPADARVSVVLRSDNGEIYSDFDVALERKPAKVESKRDKGGYRVAVARELAGTIGGGGPELFLKTFNGDLLLHRAQ